jgi:undecaprenyl-diphosphatase
MKLTEFQPFFFQDGNHYRQITVLFLLLVIVCGVWGFFAITDEVVEGEKLSYDEWILIMMRDGDGNPLGPSWIQESIKSITALGSTTILVLVLTALSGFLVLQKNYKSAALIFITSCVGVSLVVILKSTLDRPRPDVISHLVKVTSQSYPSGHTTMSAVVYLSLASMLAHIQDRKRIKIYSIGMAILLTFAVGMSRIYLGVHYPSDVLAGWALGLSWASFCWILFRYLDEKIINP